MCLNGASLNVCSATFLKQLGYAKECIDHHHKITIKAYDEVEHKSSGLVVLPLRVGPIERDVTCQVLNIPLAYNIFSDRPWIHEIQVVHSIYHQCVKFSFQGSEVTIDLLILFTLVRCSNLLIVLSLLIESPQIIMSIR